MALIIGNDTGEYRRSDNTIHTIRDLNIIQYNCGNANNSKARPFLDSINPKEYLIIALQEPIITERNPHSTYYPKNYQLSREIKFGVKVIFLIYNKIPLIRWKVIEATEFIEHLQIQLEEDTLDIINVYNPPGPANEPRISKWKQLKPILQNLADNHTLVISDFNIHHLE